MTTAAVAFIVPIVTVFALIAIAAAVLLGDI